MLKLIMHDSVSPDGFGRVQMVVSALYCLWFTSSLTKVINNLMRLFLDCGIIFQDV